MKRHNALAPLSREHHPALLLSQLLKKNAPHYKGLPDDAAGKALYASSFYKTKLVDHFIREEAMLGLVTQYHTDIEKLSAEIINEHKLLSGIFTSLDNPENLTERLDMLGKTLENHIRKEERILFPLIELYCPLNVLDSILT
jgi:Hemerythrin HHE cation binding domain